MCIRKQNSARTSIKPQVSNLRMELEVVTALDTRCSIWEFLLPLKQLFCVWYPPFLNSQLGKCVIYFENHALRDLRLASNPEKRDHPATRYQVKTNLNGGTYLDLYGLFESVFSVTVSPSFVSPFFLYIILAKNRNYLFGLPKIWTSFKLGTQWKQLDIRLTFVTILRFSCLVNCQLLSHVEGQDWKPKF